MVPFVGILPAACRNDQNEFGNEDRVPRTVVVVVVAVVWYLLGTKSVH